MKHLTIEVAEIEGEPAAFLHCEPLYPQLPAPMPLPIPEKADAGHIAAQALYLTLGEDATVAVSPKGEALLGDLVDGARKRGVYVGEDNNTLLVSSDDGSKTVELVFLSGVRVG